MMRVTSLCLTSLSELLCLFLLIPGFTRTLVSPCFVCKEYWIVLWLCQVVFTCRPHLSQRSLQSIFCVSTPSCRKGFFPLDRFIISISLQLWFFCFGYTDRPFFIFSHVLVFCFVATFYASCSEFLCVTGHFRMRSEFILFLAPWIFFDHFEITPFPRFQSWRPFPPLQLLLVFLFCQARTNWWKRCCSSYSPPVEHRSRKQT